MNYIPLDPQRPLDLILLGRVAIDFNPVWNDQVKEDFKREIKRYKAQVSAKEVAYWKCALIAPTLMRRLLDHKEQQKRK